MTVCMHRSNTVASGMLRTFPSLCRICAARSQAVVELTYWTAIKLSNVKMSAPVCNRTAGRQRATPEQDVELPIDVTLEEAYKGASGVSELTEANGTTRRLEVKIPVGCQRRLAYPGICGTGNSGYSALACHFYLSRTYHARCTLHT